MRFYFHEHAETEFDRTVEYYEDCRHGLGIEFAQEVYATIDRIIQCPEAWSPMSKNTLRLFFRNSLLLQLTDPGQAL